MLTPVLSI